MRAEQELSWRKRQGWPERLHYWLMFTDWPGSLARRDCYIQLGCRLIKDLNRWCLEEFPVNGEDPEGKVDPSNNKRHK